MCAMACGECIACGKEGSKKCGRCKYEVYCSPECQKVDWTRHKQLCGKIRVGKDAEKGRFIVACQDFAKGDVLFEEDAMAFSIHGEPNRSQTQRLCIGCARPIFNPFGGAETHKVTCACGYKFCSEHCPGRAGGRHDIECELLAKHALPVAEADNFMFYLRALQLSSLDESLWRRFCLLTRHDELITEAWPEQIETETLSAFKGISEKDVQTVRTITRTNAWTLVPNFHMDADSRYGFAIAKYPLHHGSAHGKATCIGFMTSMVEHSCVPNAYLTAWYCQDGPLKLVCRAARGIQKDEHVAWSYLSAKELMEDTLKRGKRMLVSKRFTCQCNRCLDQTDGGAFIGSLCCLAPQCGGYCIPRSADGPAGECECNRCSAKESGLMLEAEITQQRFIISNGITSEALLPKRREAVMKLLGLLSHNKARLHDSHSIVFNIKQTIASMLGQTREPLSAKDGETLHNASLNAADLLARVTKASSPDLAALYFYAARGSVSRHVDMEMAPWQAHFDETRRLLGLALDHYRASLGPDHDLTDRSKMYVDFCRKFSELGPEKMKKMGKPPDGTFLNFLGEELCSFLFA